MTSTGYGKVLLVRWLTGIVLAAVIVADLIRTTPATAASSLVLAVVLALALAAGGHAQTAARPWLAIPVQALHTGAAAAWFGGLVQLAVLSARSSVPFETLGRWISRFSRFGLFTMLLLAVSGGMLTVDRLFNPRDLVETSYGLRLGIKLVWVAGVLALAAVNRFVIVPRFPGEPVRFGRAVHFGLAAEAAVGLVVLIMAAFLAVTPPPIGPADRYIVYLEDYRFEPAELVIRAGRVTRVIVDNRGNQDHDWSVPEMPHTGLQVTGGSLHAHGQGFVHLDARPGERKTIEFIPLRPGRYKLLCTVPPHADLGMQGWVVVTE
ncbi:MAG: CopD family protein [Clostridia bacterium]|nr:CopD family protein [Clostridia bacterium]